MENFIPIISHPISLWAGLVYKFQPLYNNKDQS